MADVGEPISPGHMLRRAQTLRTDKHGALIDSDRPRRANSLGAAILKKLRRVKDNLFSRPAPSSGRSTPVPGVGDNNKRKGHFRSFSAPQVSNMTLQPAPNLLIAHVPTLSTVSEKTEVMSPIVEESKRPEDIVVPQLLQLGTPMTKVTTKKHKKFVFRLDPDLGHIVWESKQHKIIPIENIKEIRSGRDARHHREQFQLAQEYEDRWLTIIYILDGEYKTLHLIVATKDVFRMWDTTLRQLHAVRQELMSGLGSLEVRQTLWEKQYWKNADQERDHKLTFEEVEKLCKRLNINSSKDDLYRLFKQADVKNREYLDFEDFRKFVKFLKGRPEIHRLYNKLKIKTGDTFDFNTFQGFMQEEQESMLGEEELRAIFSKYTSSTPTMGLDAFTKFLLSPDNSAFSDQSNKVHHDMTRPLPDYFVSSSHNTYLVGHQLVGDSTIEGYIRALLHGCRSVEVDIYDGDTEPMIFHGKTLTSKVSLRQVCQAIKKYGFVASPYPIIISAEVHCGVAQQDMIAVIMIEVFGDSLIREPYEGRAKIEVLPSPDELRGKIMLKTKNLLLASPDSAMDDSSYFTEQSSASASEAEYSSYDYFDPVQAPPIQDVPVNKRKNAAKLNRSDSKTKDQLANIGNNVLSRVRSIGKSAASPQTPQAPPLVVVQDVSDRVLSPAPLTARRATLQTPKALPPGTPVSANPLVSPPGLTVRRTSENGSKPKMSLALVALLVYTVGVKCRGLNKKEEYAPEHMFSLSENMANKMLKAGMMDLIKHARTHLVRIYPKGTRLSSTNFEPHRFWAAGCQLVALNWQTFDLGYMINHAMFQRNGRSGYVLKPLALRTPNKDLLMKKTSHMLKITVISAQQLPRPKNALGHEIVDRLQLDPFVEVSLYVPDWPFGSDPGVSRSNSTKLAAMASPRRKRDSMFSPTGNGNGKAVGVEQPALSAPLTPGPTSMPSKTIMVKTGPVKNNGFNPVWEEKLQLPFECVGDMMDLVFVRFVVRRAVNKEGDEPLAVYCASLGSLGRGYRHLPLHDSQLSQYLFSTLFVRVKVVDL